MPLPSTNACFLTWCGDALDEQRDRAAARDAAEELAQVGRSAERGNEVFRGFALRHQGAVVSSGADGGVVTFPLSAVGELPALQAAYEEAAGTTVSVGVAPLLSQAARALEVARRRGGDQAVPWTDDLEAELRQEPGEDVGKAEGDEADLDLEKMQPAIAFPKLGAERRTDTPIVTTNAQHALRERLMGAAYARRLDTENPGLAPQVRAHTAKVADKAARRKTAVPSTAGGVSMEHGVRAGFALDSSLFPKGKGVDAYAHPNSPLATQHHENFHQAMTRLEELHPGTTRQEVAKKLLLAVPRDLHGPLFTLGKTFGLPMEHENFREESIALLHDYLNNPAMRAQARHMLRLDPDRALAFDQAMKRSYHAVSRAAAEMTPEDLGKAEEQELDKAVLDPNAGYEFRHKPGDRLRDGYDVQITAHHPSNPEGPVGKLDLRYDGKTARSSTAHSHDVYVHPEHRRKGLASAMYGYAERKLGVKMTPSKDQTADGKALWRGNKAQGQFGKAEPAMPAPDNPANGTPPAPAAEPGAEAPPCALAVTVTTSLADAAPLDVASAPPPHAAPSLQDRVRGLAARQLEQERLALQGDRTAGGEARERLASLLEGLHGKPEELKALVLASPGMADTLRDLFAAIRDVGRVLPSGGPRPRPDQAGKPVEKAQGLGSVKGREHVVRPVGAVIEPGGPATGRVKVQHETELGAPDHQGWIQGRAGLVRSNDQSGHPDSARHPTEAGRDDPKVGPGAPANR